MTAPLSDVRLQHLARLLHGLGERTIYELLRAQILHGGDLLARCESYAAIAPADLVVTGGDRFPPRLAVLEGGQQ